MSLPLCATICHPAKIERKSVVEQTKPSQTQWPNNGVEMYWNDYHMGFAKHAALKSKDSTQGGAVAIGLHKQVVETGFNGPPRGVLDSPERRERPAKYLFAAHAEANLVATAARARLEGTTVYVTHFCCSGCAKSLIQAGVSRVVGGGGVTSMPDEEFEAASAMFAEAGVVVERLGGPDE